MKIDINFSRKCLSSIETNAKQYIQCLPVTSFFFLFLIIIIIYLIIDNGVTKECILLIYLNPSKTVRPRWTVEPTDKQFAQGSDAKVDCKADGFPQPTISWKKAVGKSLNH